jgi:hypothetical protein
LTAIRPSLYVGDELETTNPSPAMRTAALQTTAASPSRPRDGEHVSTMGTGLVSLEGIAVIGRSIRILGLVLLLILAILPG